LGLVHGHYKIDEDVDFVGDILGSGSVGINSGIAVVIPAHKISELLLTGDLAEVLMDAKREWPEHEGVDES